MRRVTLPAQSRRPREHTPRFAIIHTTQGDNVISVQASSTINWFQGGGGMGKGATWGPSADILIDHLGNETWFVDQQWRDFRESRSSRANWSAGYGHDTSLTFGADEYGIAIELVQTAQGERPPQATLDAAVKRCAALAVEYGWDIARITNLTQRRDRAIPTGFVGHEDTANGQRTGKWDPNKRTFPWDWFIDAIAAEVGDMAPQYTFVQPGDTMSRIADRVGLSLHTLRGLNAQIEDPDLIEVGQGIRLHQDAELPPRIPIKQKADTQETKRHIHAARAALDKAEATL